MASVKISELPAGNLFAANDVVVFNDATDNTTKKILGNRFFKWTEQTRTSSAQRYPITSPFVITNANDEPITLNLLYYPNGLYGATLYLDIPEGTKFKNTSNDSVAFSLTSTPDGVGAMFPLLRGNPLNALSFDNSPTMYGRFMTESSGMAQYNIPANSETQFRHSVFMGYFTPFNTSVLQNLVTG